MKQSIRTHGRTFTGVVIADRMQDTATVEWTHRNYVPKFERYESKVTRMKAHNPAQINAKKGDIVEIQECRPLSKTKHFVIVKKVGEERLFAAREEMMEASKKRSVKEEEEDETS